jgi:NAD(P)-dependent dehydrogenase (short-subunit alcohol dehydrogenase family)
MEFEGKAVVVTGAGGGFGEEIAGRFAALGAFKSIHSPPSTSFPGCGR